MLDAGMAGGGVTLWQRRADDVMILTTWGWLWDGNAVWLATSSHVPRRLAADWGSGYVTLAPGRGGSSRGGSEWWWRGGQSSCCSSSAKGLPSAHCTPASPVTAPTPVCFCTFPQILDHFLNSARSCQLDREITVSTPLHLTSVLACK